MSDKWNRLDDVRRGGWYGHQVSEANVQAAQSYWQDIKTWANT